MNGGLQNLKRYLPLVRELVERDLKVKYRRSVLGYLWSLLNPLLMMGVMTLVFSHMFRFDIPNYPLYLICGQTLWSFFSEATGMALPSVLQNGQLIRKVYLPKYIFPVSRVCSSFVITCFSMVAIVIVMLVTGARLYATMLLIPVPLFFLLLFSMGVGLTISSLTVYFWDVTHLYGVLQLVWMYATPIFYPASALPEKLQIVVQLNPMYQYISFFRELVLYGNIPDASAWGMMILSSFSMLLIGVLVFRRLQRNFILYI